jgi:hypothetical protein
MYLSEELLHNKQEIETTVTAFSDHLAVLIRINLETPVILRGKGRWSMNSSLLKDRSFQKKMKEEWKEWIKHINRYPDLRLWWADFVKKKIQVLF